MSTPPVSSSPRPKTPPPVVETEESCCCLPTVQKVLKAFEDALNAMNHPPAHFNAAQREWWYASRSFAERHSL